MAITSFGYGGTVGEAAWARMAPRLGVPYWVKDGQSLVATIDTARDRAIKISPGEFGGTGVFDTSDAVESLQFDSVSSGSRYDLVVARRDWQGVSGKTTLQVIKGGKALALPTYNRNPGVVDDQPLFLVEVKAGQSRPATIYDLRGFGANGKVVVYHKLAMDYYTDYPGLELQVGREIYTVRAGRTWMRTGLEPRATGGKATDDYYIRMDTGETTWAYGGSLRPVQRLKKIGGDNAMGVRILSGGRIRIGMSGIYAINASVYDQNFNTSPARFFGMTDLRLNTPDWPRAINHRHDKSTFYQHYLSTTQYLKEGTDLQLQFRQYEYSGNQRSRKYSHELVLHMIG